MGAEELARSVKEVTKCLRRKSRPRAEQAADLEKRLGGVTDDARRFEFMAAEKRTRIEAMKDAPSLS